ncbi:CLUMA_CG009171, isoform A [Clunio marinus]|uniref:CLUMA_CG009171, isoform A n=1 Tax=Clunio marinus TaxID=568069 RepID=A0A1J1I7J8_9DIPT|nr:CLUMA_CG009171, isoform A [Clunio marinus]
MDEFGQGEALDIHIISNHIDSLIVELFKFFSSDGNIDWAEVTRELERNDRKLTDMMTELMNIDP